VLGWWFAFTREVRRERTFTIDDMQTATAYRDQADHDPRFSV
jgi:hypothetical protein